MNRRTLLLLPAGLIFGATAKAASARDVSGARGMDWMGSLQGSPEVATPRTSARAHEVFGRTTKTPIGQPGGHSCPNCGMPVKVVGSSQKAAAHKCVSG